MNNVLKQTAQLTIVNAIIFWLIITLFQSPSQQHTRVTHPTPTTPPRIQTNSVIQTTTPAEQSMSAFEKVTQHARESDCWMIIEGHVYDITAYFGSHPGGDARLLAYCGKDATSAFQSKDGTGRDHSAAARAVLQSFLIE